MQEGPHRVHLPQLRAPSDVPPGLGTSRPSVRGCESTREAVPGAGPAHPLGDPQPGLAVRSQGVSVSSLDAGARLLCGIPHGGAPLTGTHRALVYLLKTHMEGLLFCFPT